MANHASLSFDNDTAFVEGEVDFTTVVPLRRQVEAWLRGAAPENCHLDLGKVTGCNSAATTLLLSCLRTANGVGKILVIGHIPSALRSLMDLGGLEHLLPAE